MDDTYKNQSDENQHRLKDLDTNEALLRKVIRIAQFESEVDLGVNPTSVEQANTGNLTENDFEYIRRVLVLVEKRLKDPNWIKKTLDEIENRSSYRRDSVRGVRFDDELFKAGRGILESFINDNEQTNNK